MYTHTHVTELVKLFIFCRFRNVYKNNKRFFADLTISFWREGIVTPRNPLGHVPGIGRHSDDSAVSKKFCQSPTLVMR